MAGVCLQVRAPTGEFVMYFEHVRHAQPLYMRVLNRSGHEHTWEPFKSLYEYEPTHVCGIDETASHLCRFVP